jgi:hypothetical protein
MTSATRRLETVPRDTTEFHTVGRTDTKGKASAL